MFRNDLKLRRSFVLHGSSFEYRRAGREALTRRSGIAFRSLFPGPGGKRLRQKTKDTFFTLRLSLEMLGSDSKSLSAAEAALQWLHQDS